MSARSCVGTRSRSGQPGGPSDGQKTLQSATEQVDHACVAGLRLPYLNASRTFSSTKAIEATTLVTSIRRT